MKPLEHFGHYKLKEKLIPFIFFITSLLFLGIVNQFELERLNRIATQEIAEIRARIEHAIVNAVNPVDALHSLVEAENGLPPIDEFIKFTKSMEVKTPILLALQLAPDGIVRLTTKPEKNHKAIGHDLFKDPIRHDQVLRALYTGQAIVTGPVTLIQGGDALIIRKPIFIAGAVSRTGVKDFFGFSIGVIDITQIYRDSDVDWEKYALRGRDGLGQNGDIFYGASDIFNFDNIQMEVTLPTGSWVIARRAPVMSDYAFEFSIIVLITIFTLCASIYLFVERNKAKLTILNKNHRLHVASVIGKLGFIEVLNDESFDLSPGARRILDISDKDTLPSTVQVILLRKLNELESCQNTKKQEGEAITFFAKNGQNRTVEFTPPAVGMNPIIFAVRDITEATNRHNTEKVVAKLASIGELAAGVAHELNTPLQYITDNLLYLKKSIAEIVCLNPVLNADNCNKMFLSKPMQDMFDEFPAAINDCIIGVERMTRIVSALKSYSSPSDNTQLQAVEIGQIILDAIELTTGTHKYISKINFNKPLQPIRVSANQDTLTQVFINLINNACDAISERYEQDPNAPKGIIGIELKIIGNKLHINFSDNGGGIPENIRGKIFDLFFTTKNVGKGTGQGLAIIQAIIRHCNGGISYQALPPDGSLFIIELNLY